jgi:predicted GIY-YIG superfamily endonuclease
LNQAGEVDHQEVIIPLKNFLTMTHCPPEWRRHDVYLFRDDEVVFYVGQSYDAFERVWEHLHGGFKGRSVVGRFVLCNWPRSMRFIIELMSSKSARFDAVGNSPDAAERHLVEQLSPCFNEAMNRHPTPLPNRYLPPNVLVRRPRSIKRMIREAGYAVRSESNKQLWGRQPGQRSMEGK